MLQTALGYLQAGLSVLPAKRSEKRPAVSQWKQYQEHLPTADELQAMFTGKADAICIVTGTVSGNLEMIDFDNKAELYEQWKGLVCSAIPSIFAQLTIERSQSGGIHVIYRSDEPICGNIKLAQRENGDRPITLIETRGEGGLFLCAPTPGYELVQGAFDTIPTLSASDRDMLLQAAWELNEYNAPVHDAPKSQPTTALRPGDDFNLRGDVRAILKSHGWQLVRQAENEYWRRPGKSSGWSATLKDRVFYVHSSNAYPFLPNQAYSPFAVYTLLEHNGNFDAAAQTLSVSGYGESNSGLISSYQPTPQKPAYADPGPIDDTLLEVPGFISDVMQFTLETSPYPNKILAFAGALILQAFLTGRKVRDEMDNRTNLYLLALADSGTGKNRPRQVNREILYQCGLAACIGDKFASGEGLQDALYQNPAMLFQTDEIDGVLRTINQAKDSRHESIPNTLLSLYTDSNSIVPMRAKAGNQTADAIDQPHLCLFGTAVPRFFYESLSEQMLTNGFFSRLMIFEADTRGKGRRIKRVSIPKNILDIAQYWANYQPGKSNGNLSKFHPEPTIITATEEAQAAIDAFWARSDDKYAEACERRNDIEQTLWTRAIERLCKLSLLYATSENHEQPQISIDAVNWAEKLIEWQTQRMLFMVSQHVANGEFDAMCLKLLRYIQRTGTATRKDVLRHMRCRTKELNDVLDALIVQEKIVAIQAEPSGAGRPATLYRAV